jgi:hypothetical protein
MITMRGLRMMRTGSMMIMTIKNNGNKMTMNGRI